MTTARWRLLGATGAAAVVAFLLLPDRAAELWYQLIAFALLVLLGGVLVLDRRRVERSWWLLAAGIGAFTVAGALGSLQDSQGLLTVQVALVVLAYAAFTTGTLRLIGLRTNLRDIAGIIDVVMLAGVVAVVLWQFVTRQHLGDPGPLGSPAAIVLFPILSSIAVALSVRFMFCSAWRLTSAWLVFGATLAIFAGNVGFVRTYDSSRAVPQGFTGAAWLLSILLLVLAATHRSRSELTRATLPGLSKVPYARLAVMGSACIAAPTIALSNAHAQATGLVPAIGSLLLTVLLVGRLIRVVIEREVARAEIGQRAKQQIALVRLGQRALAGSELARLFEEATLALAETMRIDYSGVFEPAGAETLVLRAAVGWPVADSHRRTVSTAEPFFGVPLVAGAPGYLDSEHHTAGIRSCELLTNSHSVSGVSVTIGTPAQRYGVLAVASTVARRFSADDVTFLRAVANVLTSAIESSRTDVEVRQSALHDPLTGLPNRVLLLDRLESALRRARRQGDRVAVMFVDLDGFKAVNDTFGHRAGDQLLVAVARRLQQALRTEDTLARLAGDEFVVVCEGINDLATISELATRIVETLRETFMLDDGAAQISGSVGISVGSGHGDDVDLLLRDADAATYRAKKAGRSRFELAADEWLDAQRAV